MTTGGNNEADSPYDAYYFAHSCGRPYRRDEYWPGFFGRIAQLISDELRPRSVLDVGCAMGFLVDALRVLGVEAYGIDISEYALEQVRDEIKPFVSLASATEPLTRDYDLIVAIEVLEHLSAADGETVLDNICSHTGDVLFSSSPHDFAEPTHVNVQPPEYWAAQFARRGFLRDFDFTGTLVTPWAVRFTRRKDSVPRVVSGYERRLWRLEWERHQVREQLNTRHAEVVKMETQIREANEERDQRSRPTEEEHDPFARISEEERDRLARIADVERSLRLELAQRVEQLEEERESLQRAETAAREAQERLAAIEGTKTFRYTSRGRLLWARARRALGVDTPAPSQTVLGDLSGTLRALIAGKRVVHLVDTPEVAVTVAAAARRSEAVVSDSELVPALMTQLERHGVRERVDIHVMSGFDAFRCLPAGSFDAVVVERPPDDVERVLECSLVLLVQGGVVVTLGGEALGAAASRRGLTVEARDPVTVVRRTRLTQEAR